MDMKSAIARELADVGFHSDVQKRGLIKWINGILIVLLLLSVAGNCIQWKHGETLTAEHYKQLVDNNNKMNALNDKYIGVFLEMLNKQGSVEKKIDTASVIVDAALKTR